MKKKKQTKGKEVFISVLLVLILLVAVFGISYAVWQKTLVGKDDGNGSTGYVSFSYTESDTNIVTISNPVAMSDDAGKKLTSKNNTFDFSVSAKYVGLSSLQYEIYTEPLENTLDSKFVKVYLTNQNDVPVLGYDMSVPTYNNLEDSSDGKGKKLYEGTLAESGKIENFRLRIWTSSDYSMSATKPYRFSFKVHVKGMA